jgi:uncharacterized protein (TIGR00730 family)
MKIAVFCSCSEGLSPLFFAEMEQLGEALAKDGHEIIYGGANTGCMGALARGVQSQRGRLIGVVPEMDFMNGLVQKGLTEQRIVPTLSSRKVVMNELAEGFIVFPGGLGTLDEALEVMALKSLGNFAKPIVFYNFLGVWTPFLEALELLAEQRLIRTPLRELLRVVDKQDELRENFKHAL